MEESEKELLESIKNIDTKKLIMEQTYVEILLNDSFRQAFIYEIKGNNDDIFILTTQNVKEFLNIPINMLYYYSENDYTEEYKTRDDILNLQLSDSTPDKLIFQINKKLKSFNIKLNSKKINPSKKGYNNNSLSNIILTKTSNNENKISDKNGKNIDITGYYLYQFLCGYILDCLSIINDELLKKNLDNSQKSLFAIILDIIIYMGEVVKSNLKNYKTTYYNRKLLIVSQIHAILIGFDSLIWNIILKYQYNYSSFPELESRFKEISNIVYQIILASKDTNSIPLPCLIIFII